MQFALLLSAQGCTVGIIQGATHPYRELGHVTGTIRENNAILRVPYVRRGVIGNGPESIFVLSIDLATLDQNDFAAKSPRLDAANPTLRRAAFASSADLDRIVVEENQLVPRRGDRDLFFTRKRTYPSAERSAAAVAFSPDFGIEYYWEIDTSETTTEVYWLVLPNELDPTSAEAWRARSMLLLIPIALFLDVVTAPVTIPVYMMHRNWTD